MRASMREQYIESIFKFKWIIVGIIFFVYGLFLKKGIAISAYYSKLPFNVWDITLRLMNDMYLNIYFITPLIMFISARVILENFNDQILIRVGSYRKWVCYSLFKFWLEFLPFLSVWVLISIFMMIGFPHSWKWSTYSGTHEFGNPLFQLPEHYAFPLSVLICQILLIILSISFTQIVLSYVFAFTKKRIYLIVIIMSMFIGGIVSFKVLPPKFSFLFPSTYLSIAKSIYLFGSANLLYFFLALLIIISILLLSYSKKTIIYSIVSTNLPLIIYCLISLTGIIATSYFYRDSTVWDIWLLFLGGVSADNFSYLSFFSYSIVYFGFIYLIQLFFSKEVDQLGYYQIIRYQSLYKWFWSWMKKLIYKILLFLFLLFIITLLTALVIKRELVLEITLMPISLSEGLYHYYINGFLQILFYVLVLFILTWVSKESMHGVIVISVFMVLMFPGINFAGFIPVGLNSLVYLYNYSPYLLTINLLIVNLLAYITIYYLFKKSLKI